jgi:type VI secretion system protein VasD
MNTGNQLRLRLMTAARRCGMAALLPVLLSACASSPTTVVMDSLGAMKDKALESVGIKKADVPEAAKPERNISWRIQASESLNTDAQGQPLALLTRIYKLKSPGSFMQIPYEVFGDPVQEKARLGDELIETREVQLIPGQRYESNDKVAREARYVAIVALYRQPAAQRWRYVFSTEAAEKSGLVLGAHACALTVQSGEPIGLPLSLVRSADMPCR